MEKADIIIIGAGASGLMTAAVAAAQGNGERILIFEKKNEPGKKILASGNGRCNLSNSSIDGHEKTLEFFRNLGIITRTDEEGRIYPYSESSKDVRDALSTFLKKRGVRIETGTAITEAIKTRSGFRLKGIKKNRNIAAECNKLVIATGGKSAPELGTTGDGYNLARRLGHHTSPLIPVLTSIETVDNTENFKGVREKCGIRLLFEGRELFRERGEVLFTSYGISGICVFNLSRFMTIPEGKTFRDGFNDYRIEIDFLPDFTEKEVLCMVRSGIEREKGAGALRSIVKPALAEEIAARGKNDPVKTALILKSFMLQPKGTKGWKQAQVTRGGVLREELNMKTMESLLVRNLYFTGEVIDYDGPCGGFNLENAWSTGITCGRVLNNSK